jgi:DNA-binding CsgD family transcriptional regulator
LQSHDLDSDAELVYRMLLDHPQGGAHGLAARLVWPDHRVAAAIDRLTGLALVQPDADAPGRIRPINPETSLTKLLLQEKELIDRQQEIAAGKAALARVIADCNMDRFELGGEVRELDGLDEIRAEIARQANACVSDMAVFAPDGGQRSDTLDAARPLDESLLSRGVRVRYVWLDSARNHQTTVAYGRWICELGGAVRTTPQLPPRMIIYDRRVAIVPIDPEVTGGGALVIRVPGAVLSLYNLFKREWREAVPLSVNGRRDHNGLKPQERAVLELLLAGLTDDAMARKLAVSVRSVRRVTAGLMQRLGASSRFQAGALAAARGWIDPE